MIPYCIENDIAVVTYSSIAQGILTGKFPLNPTFGEGDNRANMVHFEPDVWPHVYAGVEKLKDLSPRVGRPMIDLAIRWVAAQPGVRSVLVGVRNAEQVHQNAAAMAGEIDQSVFDEMSAIANEIMAHTPDTGNIFRYYP